MTKQFEYDYDVFISYSSLDKEWVRGVLLKRIEEANLRAFIDFRDFKRGAPSIKEMERGVSICRKTLLVLTPNYTKSEWCEIENIMIQTLSPANRDLRLVPLLKVQCEKPLRIDALTHIDFTDGADLDLAWHQLISALGTFSDALVKKTIPPDIQAELNSAKAFIDADKFTEAIPILENALIAVDNSDHNVTRVKVRLDLGHALYEAREDLLGAERQFRDALVLVPIENLDLRHSVLNSLGDMLLFSGKLDEAKATLHASLDVAKLSGKIDNLAESLISLSLLENAFGFHEIAVAKIDEALQLLLQQALFLPDDEKKHHAYMLAICYINKALLCRDAGNFDEALAFYRKVEEQHCISGDKLDAGKALLFCGEVYCENADWENGFKCFQRALEYFFEIANPLWMARATEHISRLYATHERWEEALQAILAAASGAEESGHSGEQVHFLCMATQLLRKWKVTIAKENIARSIHKLSKDFPADKQGEVMSNLSAMMGEMSDNIEKAVREDKEVYDLLKQAKAIAQSEHLPEHLANCLLDEAHEMIPLNDIEAQHALIVQAIELLQGELQKAQFPKRRSHIMGRISDLYRELSKYPEALSWLKKAGDVYEKSGDVFGLANFYSSQAEIHRLEGRLDEEIASYQEVLSIIQGRSFYYLAAGTRINLAVALGYRREFEEAQKLLDEAETLSEQHHFKIFNPAIAKNRSDIEEELQIAQVPNQTLTQLLNSLHQLISYHPEHAEAYLLFWYFAWKTELLALLRSGPFLSLMVLTNNVESFLKLATKFHFLADHFLLTTSHAFTIRVEAKILPIPPTWLFPKTFRFLVVKKNEMIESIPEEQETLQNEEVIPRINLLGPATLLPLYMPIDEKSDIEGEGHMMALSTAYLPQEAVDLMIHRQINELIRQQMVWFPTERFSSKDPLLTDLQIGHERGVFPVYFDNLPTSDSVTACGGVQIVIPNKFLNVNHPSITAKWRLQLLKLTKLPKEDAQIALFDLPAVFSDPDDTNSDSTKIEVLLLEFNDINRQIVYPVLLIKD